MKRILGTTVAVLSVVLVATASASAGSESITTMTVFPSFPSGPPNMGTYSGTYAAAGTFDDSGSVRVEALFAAVPSPSVSVLQTRRTYTSLDGHGTLVLRCSQHATAADFQLYPDVPGAGPCAVTAAAGDFAGLSRSGPLSGTAYFNPSGTGGTLVDTVVLGG
jgi:hypothetical protein